MDYVYEICNRCVDRHCCRGLCEKMNDYLVKKRENLYDKSFKLDNKSSKIK